MSLTKQDLKKMIIQEFLDQKIKEASIIPDKDLEKSRPDTTDNKILLPKDPKDKNDKPVVSVGDDLEQDKNLPGEKEKKFRMSSIPTDMGRKTAWSVDSRIKKGQPYKLTKNEMPLFLKQEKSRISSGSITVSGIADFLRFIHPLNNGLNLKEKKRLIDDLISRIIKDKSEKKKEKQLEPTTSQDPAEKLEEQIKYTIQLFESKSTFGNPYTAEDYTKHVLNQAEVIDIDQMQIQPKELNIIRNGIGEFINYFARDAKTNSQVSHISDAIKRTRFYKKYFTQTPIKEQFENPYVQQIKDATPEELKHFIVDVVEHFIKPGITAGISEEKVMKIMQNFFPPNSQIANEFKKRTTGQTAAVQKKPPPPGSIKFTAPVDDTTTQSAITQSGEKATAATEKTENIPVTSQNAEKLKSDIITLLDDFIKPKNQRNKKQTRKEIRNKIWKTLKGHNLEEIIIQEIYNSLTGK